MNKTHFSAGPVLFLVFCRLMVAGMVLAQEYSTTPTVLFRSSDLLSLTLTMNFREVLRDVGDEIRQHPATISYLAPDGDTIRIPIRIRTRGHFRLNPMNCGFPPLRLNFSDGTSANTVFDGQDKLKLVTHCQSRRDRYEQGVLKEYLAYRLYNLFTELSYRVRLVEMCYVDSEGRKDTLVRMGFLIEPTGQLLARNACTEIEIKRIRQGDCEPDRTILFSVFQYMIGNTDWSVPARHNVVLVQKQPGDLPLPVPFDFDWSGLVDAPYAVPDRSLEIKDVRTRLFRGVCRTEEEYERIFEEFRIREEEIYTTIRSVPRLDGKEVERTVRYMEQFFNTISNPRKIRAKFINYCRIR